jgi:integrase
MAFDETTTTLADVILKLEALQTLSDIRRRDLISAVKRIATYLNRSPADLPTDAPALREVLATIHPAQAGISAKSLANVKSNLARALKVTRTFPRDRPHIDRTLGWQVFFRHAASKHQEWALTRFSKYCCSRGIEPKDVCDTAMAEFQNYLDPRHLTKDPAKLCKEMAQTWNGIVKRNELPYTLLTYAPNPQYRCRPLSEYPESLQSDLNVYLDRLSHADLFDENGPDKPLRPSSLRNIKAHIRQFLDGLVLAGQDPDTFKSLADVIKPENIKISFRATMDRRGTTSIPISFHNIAATLTAIARHHVKVDPNDLIAILQIKKRVSTDPKGMSDKNRKRLGQFNDWENVARLLSLPEVLMTRAMAHPTSRSSALLAMHAACITILLSCPMRARNVAGLDLDHQVIPHRNGSHTIYTLRIEGKDVKNLEHVEVVLSPSKSRILRTYIVKFRPLLSKVSSPALFPSRDNGESRAPSNFSGDLKALIFRETGLVVNLHLFRHLSGFLYLQERPGDYETLRQLLKHKKLQTTMDFYATLSSQWAHGHYDEVVLQKWGGRDD